MRIRKVTSKNTEHYAIIYDTVINKKRTTKIYENLGSLEKIKQRSEGQEPMLWIKNYVADLNEKIKLDSLPVIVKKKPNKSIEDNKKQTYNFGYIPLQKIYYSLGLDSICSAITDKYQFKYDLNAILSSLIYSRIIYPSSKRKTHELTQNFLDAPQFDLQHIYRSLGVISKETDFIQATLYKNSKKYLKRNDSILYYDCTNYFFETEEPEGLKQYGKSKENRPSPIVQMGLLMDGDGLPLAFDITSGNTNEQITLRPLEEKIIKEFKKSKFIVCTDAGLSSISNRKFNNSNERKFITTQSIKKLKEFLKNEALDLSKGWFLPGDASKKYDISKLRDDEDSKDKFRNTTFYKERWIKEDGIEQRLIITYSVKYQEYQEKIRNNQIERAKKLMEKNPQKIGKAKANDSKRFIRTTHATQEGEVAESTHYSIDENLIKEEQKYDGLYAVCTNLTDDVKDIIKTNHRRWEIEESFRIMKTDFKARPVYLKRDDRIKAHFTTCFLSLVIYRFLEKKLGEKYTTCEIVEHLRNYNLKNENDLGYSPLYTKDDMINDIHNTFAFDTAFEINSVKKIKKIISDSQKP